MCVCVCACVRARARACVRVFVCGVAYGFCGRKATLNQSVSQVSRQRVPNTRGQDCINGRGPKVWRLVFEISRSGGGVRCQLVHTSSTSTFVTDGFNRNTHTHTHER